MRARVDRLEAERAVRGVLVRYLGLCDTLGEATPMDELGLLFTDDAVWVGVGTRYGAAFGEHAGRAAIVAFLDGYRLPPHFAMNAHFLSSERIVVAADRATGRWMMLQTSTFADGRSDLRAAELTIAFAREEGCWQMRRFETRNLFRRAVDRWDDAEQPIAAIRSARA